MQKRIPLFILLALLLCGCSNEPVAETTTAQTETILTGWQIENGEKIYVLENGSKAAGLVELDDNLYCFSQDGYMQTGWLEQNGNTYYFQSDGTAAVGETVIDGMTHHFTEFGTQVLVANPWNNVPQDYNPNLIKLDDSITSKEIYVDSSCYEALNKMIADCNKECPTVCIISGYRSYDYQLGLYDRKVNYYLEQGYSKTSAKTEAAKVVAVPGTSEHQLGLAVDIIDTRSWSLTEVQETLPAQKWLMENCWQYGFVLRYPNGTSSVTGIIYEPWHYRYVGEELAKVLYESNLPLEQYLKNITDKKS